MSTNYAPSSDFARLTKKYFKWHLNIINRVYGLIILKFDKSFFCFLFNLSARLRRLDVTFSYDNETGKYISGSDKYKLLFYHKKQANSAYGKGITARAYEIAQAYFLDRLKFQNGDVIVDCGANVGDLKLYFREINCDVEYIGFEPSPLEYECLRQNVAPSLTYNAGLWHEDSSLTFYVSSQGADSSFIEPPQYDEIKKIPTHRLDKIIDKPIKLLKLEAEGAEPEVLQGCEKLLEKIQYISADLGFERGKQQESTLAPVINYLLDRNFELIEVGHSRIAALFVNKNIQKKD